jgi:hypothetical protein
MLGGALALSVAASAGAGAVAPLGLGSCAPSHGFEQCSGLAASWDGVPLDATVTLPPAIARPLPLVVEINGFGNSKYEYLDPGSKAYTDNAYGWAASGYAVLTYTARGLWGSCGTPESRAANPTACARGWIHLADVRYEVRDAQYLIGRLVDEGVADPARIGVTGDSYGGGQSFDLAALRDRVMLPDGRLVPWRSPAGTPLHIAAAAPIIPWTDLAYAIAPNGHTLTYAVTSPTADTTPLGVEKASFANAIYAAAQAATGPGQPLGQPFVPGRPEGYVAPPGVDPQADVGAWVARLSAGEPYTDPQAAAIVDQVERYHSAYYIDHSEAPAPLFVANGFSDDLFPIDESLRFINRTREQYPQAPISFTAFDFGHQRGANKPADRARLLAAIHAWFDHYLRGGPAPPLGVTALTQTCPHSLPSLGPFTAPTFAQLARGEVRSAWGAPQTVLDSGGDASVGAAIDPVAGGGDDCAATPASPEAGTATYALAPAPPGGYTLLGAPTIIARLTLNGTPGIAQIAARLWDVAPGGGTQTLVARGSYRPTGQGLEVWQLHAGGWRFAAGHTAKLELLGNDAPYGRPSNGTFTIGVSRLELRLPVRETPDCRVVQPFAPPIVGAGEVLAPGVAALGDGAGCGGAPAARARGSCTSRRAFTITLPHGHGVRVLRLVIRLPHGRTRSIGVRGLRRRARIDLRGVPAGTVRVAISVRRRGRSLTLRRVYHTCARAPLRAARPSAGRAARR